MFMFFTFFSFVSSNGDIKKRRFKFVKIDGEHL